MSFLNRKRLHDYPWLMLLTTWCVLAANLLLHQGWLGGLGQIIGGDFIMFYATGQLYCTDPGLIYDYDEQMRLQQALIEPTPMPGLNPYMNPPYVAMLYSLLPALPLLWAFLVWSLLSLLCCIVAVRWLWRAVPAWLQQTGLTYRQMLVIVLSFFPFIEGLQAGQNHAITFLLITGLVLCTLSERWWLAGACAGLLLYKPQFVLGFLLIWLIWRRFKALAAFGAIAAAWGGAYLLLHGFSAYQTYSELSQAFLLLPYVEGFPAYLLVTVYGLLTTLLPDTAWLAIYRADQVLMLAFALGLAWLAYKSRRQSMHERMPVIVLALIFPLIVSPYALLHDTLILVPGFVLWARYAPSRRLLHAAILLYLGAFFLTLIAALTGLALIAWLVLGLGIGLLLWILAHKPWLGPPPLHEGPVT